MNPDSPTVPIPQVTGAAREATVAGDKAATVPEGFRVPYYVAAPVQTTVTSPAALEQKTALHALEQIAAAQQSSTVRQEVTLVAPQEPIAGAAAHGRGVLRRTGAAIRSFALAIACAAPWPLLAILTVQAVLSLRLLWSNTAYIDEATYLYVGSQDLEHWLHGTPIADYQLSLSGAPVIYPPIGAFANALGGLAAARILSLGFILGTTALLYATTKRLFGKRAALLASALFGALGATQFLSALATYDPMALFLLALAAHLVIGRRDYGSLGPAAYATVLAPSVLAVANATKYATALWDPVVIGLALCAPVIAGNPWRYGAAQAARFTTVLMGILASGLAIGKGKYVRGILFTTVDRSSRQPGMGQPPGIVLYQAWKWAGVVIAIAALGILLLLLYDRVLPVAAIGVLLALATVAAPLHQAWIGTSVSLQKHVVFGAWFGCILAGYALARLFRYRILVAGCAAVVLFAVSISFTAQASALFHAWPRENPTFIAGLRKLVHGGKQKYLIEGFNDVPAYYVGPSVNSLQWRDAIRFSYRDPETGAAYAGAPALVDAIRHRAFTLIILNFREGKDYAAAEAIDRYGGYTVIAHLPPSSTGSTAAYTVWKVMP